MIAGGGVILYFGAEWLVLGSAGLAHAFGISPLVVGLTVVAYGTSAPELAVSTAAILRDQPDIVVGNIIGSCIANIGLILGITALLTKRGQSMAIEGRLIRFEVPVLMFSAIAMPLVIWLDDSVRWWEGLILVALAVAFSIMAFRQTWRSSSIKMPAADLDVPKDPNAKSKLVLAALTLVGLCALIGGGELFVRGSVEVALALGMSPKLVGLTIIAIGTSLPELMTSMVAARRGESGLAVGNVVGSNIFNVFLVLGVVSLIKPVDVVFSVVTVDLAFLVGVTVLAVMVMRGDRRVTRTEGSMLLAAYLAFILVSIARNYGWM